jgi:hypothetical protein
VTVPRYGFRFDADVISHPVESALAEAPRPTLQPLVERPSRYQRLSKRWWLVLALLTTPVVGEACFSVDSLR